MLGTERPSGFKRLLPQSLFGRALLIMVLPAVLMQVLAVYMFYERHWDNVSRWMASSLAGEIALMIHELNDAGPAKRQELVLLAERLMGMQVRFEPVAGVDKFLRAGREVSPIFFEEMQAHLTLPFSLRRLEREQMIEIRVKLDDSLVNIQVSRKRLASATTYIFVMSMLGSAVILMGVAVLFLRNQIRPITRLAGAMEAFGQGRAISGFRPRGALEVRRAGYAFLHMKQRIERQISARMEMLAGISHDLRTPLTRMKLEVELLAKKAPDEAENLSEDVSDMEYMINEYLDFVRGEGLEAPEKLDLQEFVQEVLARYGRQGEAIPFSVANIKSGAWAFIRPHAFRRALSNIVDNALRYGEKCEVALLARGGYLEIRVDDMGPGIPTARHEEVFKPFKRLDQSRNTQTGGAGLGLTIARDIVHAHGGEVLLAESHLGGLRVHIRVPAA